MVFECTPVVADLIRRAALKREKNIMRGRHRRPRVVRVVTERGSLPENDAHTYKQQAKAQILMYLIS